LGRFGVADREKVEEAIALVNRRFAVPSAYSFRLIGYGRRYRPCKARPLGASRPLAPAFRKRVSDLQPDQVIPDSSQLF
ncbi:hypothetical protein ACVGW3_05740, partial [Enterobacter hormaechei]